MIISNLFHPPFRLIPWGYPWCWKQRCSDSLIPQRSVRRRSTTMATGRPWRSQCAGAGQPADSASWGPLIWRGRGPLGPAVQLRDAFCGATQLVHSRWFECPNSLHQLGINEYRAFIFHDNKMIEAYPNNFKMIETYPTHFPVFPKQNWCFAGPEPALSPGWAEAPAVPWRTSGDGWYN